MNGRSYSGDAQLGSVASGDGAGAKDGARGFGAGITVVIPAHNEASRVGAVVRDVVSQGLPVVVVDDGSDDGTGDEARGAGARVVRLWPNQGKGAALKEGFGQVLQGRSIGAARYGILTLDADGQHDPGEIPAFLEAWSRSGADLVIGARDYRDMPPVRWFTNSISKKLFSWALGRRIPDNQSGYRLRSCRLAQAALASSEQGFAFEVEEIAICVGRGYELVWVPIKTIYGSEKSDIKPWTHFVSFLRVTWRARARVKRERKAAAER